MKEKGDRTLKELEKEYLESGNYKLVATCKCMDKLGCKSLLERLGRTDDQVQAIGNIKRYFESELGRQESNFIICEMNSSQIEPKVFVNTTDEKTLYPHLYRVCLDRLEDSAYKPHKELITSYLNAFMSEWKKLPTFTQNASSQPQQEQSKQLSNSIKHEQAEQKETPNQMLLEQKGGCEVLKLLEELSTKDYLTIEGDNFTWGKTHYLLAYLTERINDIWKWRGSNQYIKWSPIEKLFGLKRGTLANARNEWLNNHEDFKPSGWKNLEDELT